MTKMKKNLIYLATLAVLAAACDNEDNIVKENSLLGETKMVTETITANYDDANNTRAAIGDDGAFTWSDGDQIAVHASDGKYYTSEALASGGNKSATFTVTYSGSRDAYAVFPASIVSADASNYGQDGQPLDVTLPSSYKLADVSGTKTPCPMVAVNTGTSWKFRQICGLLRLTVNNLPSDASYLKIDFNGRKVCGDFSLYGPDLGTSSISTTSSSDDVITITDIGTNTSVTVNIPLPTSPPKSKYESITVSAFSSSDIPLTSQAQSLLSSSYEAYEANRARGKKVTMSLAKGVFSVASGKYVVFSPGNLQATTSDLGTSWSWSFAEHQYDYIGNAGANTKINGTHEVSENGTVDLFGWNTNGTSHYGISNSEDPNAYRGSFEDWGNLPISGFKRGFWRTPTKDEWVYLMNTRETGVTLNSTANARYTRATINSDGTGVVGLIIIPDGYSGGTPSGVTWGSINANDYTNVTDCTIAGWNALEAEGCTFLPAAGNRKGNEVSYAGLDGNYWSSTPYNDYDAYGVSIYSSAMNPGGSGGRYYGHSVRLVRDAN